MTIPVTSRELLTESILQKPRQLNGNLLETTTETAADFAKEKRSVKENKKYSHLKNRKCEAFDLNIERSDHRVSHQILAVKINVSANEISVEHKKNKTAEFQDKYKIEFDDIYKPIKEVLQL